MQRETNYYKYLSGFLLVIIIGGVLYFINYKNNISNSVTVSNVATTTAVSAVQYDNKDYKFTFDLPEGWKGYTVITSTWEGYSLTETSDKGQVISETGPLISIRHPLWDQDNPRQDIPVMVFTLKQWNDIQSDKFHIGAAPINPSELARNSKYVFALPARYNYAYPIGYEEVDRLVQSGALKAY
jgi:hypothetical protein